MSPPIHLARLFYVYSWLGYEIYLISILSIRWSAKYVNEVADKSDFLAMSDLECGIEK